jgi:hypothetical protein
VNAFCQRGYDKGETKMSDERTQTLENSPELGISKISVQVSELGIRIEQIQTELESNHHSDVLLRVSGQVSKLEVRLSAVENLLERIARHLDVPLIAPQQVAMPKNIISTDIIGSGELSPSSRRRDGLTGSLKLTER